MNSDATQRTQPPTRPRDAASLVIYRQQGRRHEVLMGRRGQKARFKPGVYVFPGGGLERADYLARPLHPLQSSVTPAMAVGMSPQKADALAMAAVREAYEEAGLLFGLPGDIGTTRHASWKHFRAQQLSPDLRQLEFLGRAITPSYRNIRYHARFFAVPATLMRGELGGDGELEDLHWVPINDTGSLDVMVVQKMILETLHQRLSGQAGPAKKMFYAWGKNNVRAIE